MIVEQLIMNSRDFQLLEKHLKSSTMSKYNREKLESELKTAKVVKELPTNVICLNSIVEVEETVSKKKFHFQLVLPNEANIKENKISIYTPMGSALMGYPEGALLEWEMPNGVQKFKITKVEQTETH